MLREPRICQRALRNGVIAGMISQRCTTLPLPLQRRCCAEHVALVVASLLALDRARPRVGTLARADRPAARSRSRWLPLDAVARRADLKYRLYDLSAGLSLLVWLYVTEGVGSRDERSTAHRCATRGGRDRAVSIVLFTACAVHVRMPACATERSLAFRRACVRRLEACSIDLRAPARCCPRHRRQLSRPRTRWTGANASARPRRWPSCGRRIDFSGRGRRRRPVRAHGTSIVRAGRQHRPRAAARCPDASGTAGAVERWRG